MVLSKNIIENLNLSSHSIEVVKYLIERDFKVSYSLEDENCIISERRNSIGNLEFKVKIYDCDKNDIVVFLAQNTENDILISKVDGFVGIRAKLDQAVYN